MSLYSIVCLSDAILYFYTHPQTNNAVDNNINDKVGALGISALDWGAQGAVRHERFPSSLVNFYQSRKERQAFQL